MYKELGTSKMARQGKALTTKPDDLNSNPRTHRAEFSDFYIHTMASVHPTQ